MPAMRRQLRGQPDDVQKAKSRQQRPWEKQQLPIQKTIPSVLDGLRAKRDLVIQAPTGAGKTTLLPLVTLDSGLIEGRIIVLQPRRITCINVAKRMAHLWGEPIGETVGYRIRHDHKVTNRTRVEVVTEGTLVRMLHGNPNLEGVGCIFFDEFHERSIESDLSFALCLEAKKKRRLPVQLIVMSATFGSLAPRVESLLGAPQTINSEGRMFPVEVSYRDVLTLRDWEAKGPQAFARTVAEQVEQAMETHPGDVLVFVPGEREIMYLWIALNNIGIGDGVRPKNLVQWAHRLIDESKVDLSKKIQVSPLYGHMEPHEQDAVLLGKEGWRKVILATPIAESSLTVPTVRIVIDTGLRRTKSTDPESSLSVMRTLPISKASADQRKGRAGRVAEGVCYRLWSEAEQESLEANDKPELHREDLVSAVLDLAVHGCTTNQEIAALPWVDCPLFENVDKARAVLERLEIIQKRPGGFWSVTERGRLVSKFPVHPRVGHMILQAYSVSDSFARDACDVAATLEEKELLRGGRRSHGADLQARLDGLQNPNMSGVLFAVRERVLQASEQLQNIANLSSIRAGSPKRDWERNSLCVLIAWAFPELLAEVASSGSQGRSRSRPYKLHCGLEVSLDDGDRLSRKENLAVASVTGNKVFWAVHADASLLANYGISASDPVRHKILELRSAMSSEESPELPLLEIRRYLAGKSGSDTVTTFEQLVTYVGTNPSEFPPRDLVDMMWDLARTDYPNTDLLSGLVHKIVVPQAAEFSAVELAEVACTLSVAGVGDSVALEEIADAVIPRIEDLPLDSEGGNLAALLWAYTEAEVPHQGLFQALALRAVIAMVEFEPKVLSDVRVPCFWSFMRGSASSWSSRNSSVGIGVHKDDSVRGRFRGFAHPDFFELFAPLVTERLDDIHPICCVYLMWSFSKAGVHQQEVFNAVASRVAPEAKNLDRCGLAMFVWNYANIGEENEEVYRTTAEETMRPQRMAEMTPRDIAAIAGSFGRARVLHHPLLEALSQHGCGLLKDGIEQQCFRKPAKSLAREIYIGDNSARDGRVDAFDMVSLADMLGAYADQQFVHQEFLELADEYMLEGLRQPPHYISNFLRYPTVFVRTMVARARISSDKSGQEMFKAAAPHLVRIIEDVGARNVTQIVWAWAVLGPRDPWALAALSTRLKDVLESGSGSYIEQEDVDNVNWALDELKLRDRKLTSLLNSVGS
eukprot:TRINITY_DN48345_c0_g1_i1.p1 TRINITY_DN48345_c0_g1~~TRINITY_DN48345_c0_g1_i1.p1  ORF type:complete len:1326 (+),score=207.03 TRINITY_DN48345_c0_g1_i1:354-3980(+)